jgi:hypothetical protein
VNRAAELRPIAIGFLTLVAARVAQGLELGRRDVLEAPALELRGPLERDQALVVVGVDA